MGSLWEGKIGFAQDSYGCRNSPQFHDSQASYGRPTCRTL